MKTTFFYFFILISFLSCEKKKQTSNDYDVKISDRLYFIKGEDGLTIVNDDKNFFLEKEKLPLKKIILLNSSLIGYLEELGQVDKIIGVVSPEHIFSPKVHQNINNGKIQIVGNMQKLDVEKIIALSPDAVLTNYISTQENFYSILKNNGIKIIFLDEYLEKTPLEKAAYLKVFGALFGVEQLAEEKFQRIKNQYISLKTKVENIEQKPIVMANEMYGNIWYMPGGKSMMATIINDAGGRYFIENQDESGSVSFTFEQVLVDFKKATVWVNAGSYSSKNELLSVNPQYRLLNAFQNGRIFSLSKAQKGSANNFFEQGNVRADLLLRDYITAFYPSVFPKDSLTYLQELE